MPQAQFMVTLAIPQISRSTLNPQACSFRTPRASAIAHIDFDCTEQSAEEVASQLDQLAQMEEARRTTSRNEFAQARQALLGAEKTRIRYAPSSVRAVFSLAFAIPSKENRIV
jgi:hypothetical protein